MIANLKRLFTMIVFVAFALLVNAQNYNPILNYNLNSTPANGVKIKTNIPFNLIDGTHMPTITIEGYNYGTGDVIGISIVWYVYYGAFANYSASSWGSYTPTIQLSNEGGKVVIVINDKQYYQRFTVRAYSQGMNEEAAWFQGWTVVDESVSGSNTVLIPYKNSFGSIAVNGNIRAKEIKVENTNWPDYVFTSSYELPSLKKTEEHIKKKGHLPNIPSAEEVKVHGIDLGEMNAKLLQKIEELTLYSIDQQKKIEALENDKKNFINKFMVLEARLKKLEQLK